MAPRKGAQFIGARNRARARARGRRRRILTFLLEATGVTLLMALFPPLRPLMLATALFGLLLVLYLGMLLAVRRNERELGRMRRRVDAEVDRPASAHTNGNGHANGNGNGHGKGRRLPDRQVVAGNGRARPVYNGLDFYDQDEDVHVVVRTPPRAERVSSSRVASPVG